MPSKSGKKRPVPAEKDAEVKKSEASPKKKMKSSDLDVKLRMKIEHCKSWQVFKRKALALVEDLRKKYGEFEVELNPSAPRRGSFELVVSRDGKDDVTVWTGLKKGPPRKLKFPEAETVIAEIEKIL